MSTVIPATVIIIITPHPNGVDQQVTLKTQGPITLAQLGAILAEAQQMVANNVPTTAQG